jgi:ABC-type dipeptide/oligopeptide/nickel transport system permease component
MLAYTIRRLASSLITLWLVASLVFVIFYVLPGGAGRKGPSGITPIAQLFAGRAQGLDVRLRIQEELGLDRPVPVQYALYMKRLARGDLGEAYGFRTDVDVWPLIKGSMRPTVELVVGAALLFIAGGYWLAFLGLATRSPRLRLGWTGGTTFLMSMPHFVGAALLLLVVNAVTDGYSPVGLYTPMSEGILKWLTSMWAPWLILTLPFLGFYARLIHSGLLEVRGEDFIRTLLARGEDDSTIRRHMARASILPVLTQFGLNLGMLLGGSIVVERLFDIPGLGSLIFATSFVGDFPVLSGATLIASIVVIAANFIVDIAYMYVDPRIRFGAVAT